MLASTVTTSVPRPGGNLGRPGQQEIASQDGDEVAPAGVGAFDSPPRAGLVDDVVVVQRPHVDQLHRDGALHDVLTGARTGSGRRCQHKGRPQAFPTRFNQVGGHLGQQRLGGSYRPAQLLFHPGQAFVEPGKVEQLPDVHYQTICQCRACITNWRTYGTGQALPGRATVRVAVRRYPYHPARGRLLAGDDSGGVNRRALLVDWCPHRSQRL